MPRKRTSTAQPYRDDFADLEGFLVAVVAAGADRVHQTDPRLEYLSGPIGLNEVIPSSGGFLVPIEHASELHELLYQTGSILSRATRWPATREKFTIPVVDETSRADGSRFGGVTMSFLEPGETITASRPKFASREMNRRGLKGLVYLTRELMEDAPTLAAAFKRLFALESTFTIEDAIINGNGALGPLGILNADATIEVAKEGGQSNTTIVTENIIKMSARLWSASRPRAAWLVNQNVMPQIFTLVVGVGTAVVPLFRWAADGTPLLMGIPVIETEYSATLGQRGDIILADLSEYFIADAERTTVAFSGDVKFTSDEGAFRTIVRIDGQPGWSSPTTPKNGAATVSPFVTLEERA